MSLSIVLIILGGVCGVVSMLDHRSDVPWPGLGILALAVALVI